MRICKYGRWQYCSHHQNTNTSMSSSRHSRAIIVCEHGQPICAQVCTKVNDVVDSTVIKPYFSFIRAKHVHSQSRRDIVFNKAIYFYFDLNGGHQHRRTRIFLFCFTENILEFSRAAVNRRIWTNQRSDFSFQWNANTAKAEYFLRIFSPLLFFFQLRTVISLKASRHKCKY